MKWKELRKQGLDDAAAISNDSENGKAACISCDYYLVGIDEVQTDVSRQGKKGWVNGKVEIRGSGILF